MDHFHSKRRKRLASNRKGYSGIIAAIFLVLIILFFYFNVYTFMNDRNAAFQDTVGRVTQMDVDRITEHLSVIGLSYSLEGPSSVSASFTVTNTSPLSIEIVSVWIKDLTNYGYNSTAPVPPIVLEPGERLYVPPGLSSVTLSGASSSDLFASWFVTARGRVFNTVSTVTYAPGALAGFVFNTIGNQKVGVPFTITITAVDAFGGIVQNYTGINTLRDYTGTLTLSTGPFVNGVWTTNQAVITQALTKDVILTQGGGCIGNSNPFDVTVSGVPFGLDGHSSTFAHSPITLSLTVNTTYAGDLFYIVVAASSKKPSSITSNLGFNFTNRISVTIDGSNYLQTFYGVNPFSGPVIIYINFPNGNTGDAAVVAFGISGANTALPFDVSNPPYNIFRSGTNATTSPTVPISTNNPASSSHDFIIGAIGETVANQALTNGTFFNLIATNGTGPGQTIETSAEYEIVTPPVTNLAVAYTIQTAQNSALIADAVKSGS